MMATCVFSGRYETIKIERLCALQTEQIELTKPIVEKITRNETNTPP